MEVVKVGDRVVFDDGEDYPEGTIEAIAGDQVYFAIRFDRTVMQPVERREFTVLSNGA